MHPNKFNWRTLRFEALYNCINSWSRGTVARIDDEFKPPQLGHIDKAQDFVCVWLARLGSDIPQPASLCRTNPLLRHCENLNFLKVPGIAQRAGAKLDDLHAVVVDRVV